MEDPAFQLVRQAQDALQRNDYSATVDLARRAIAEYPDHVWAHYLLAQAALAQRQWDEAVASLTTVTRLYPDRSPRTASWGWRRLSEADRPRPWAPSKRRLPSGRKARTRRT